MVFDWSLIGVYVFSCVWCVWLFLVLFVLWDVMVLLWWPNGAQALAALPKDFCFNQRSPLVHL